MTELDRRMFLSQSAGSVVALGGLAALAGAANVWTGKAALSVAVLGAGRQGRAALGELQKIDGVSVAAVCDTDSRRLASGLRRVQDAKGYASLDELLTGSPEVQAIVIATPTHTHKDIALQVIDAGKHAYIECPLAHTNEDSVEIARAARAADGVIAAGLLARSNPVYQLARDFYRSAAVKTLASMRAQDHDKTSWRSAARDPARDKALNWKLDPEVSLGLAGELGTHQFDVFHWYTGDYPKRVVGFGSLRVQDDGRDIFDTVSAQLEWPNGAVASYGCTLGNSFEGRYEVFHGSNAAIRLAWSHGWMFKEADAPTQGWEVYANRQKVYDEEGITLIAGATQLAEQGKLQDGIGLPYPSLYYGLSDWINAIDKGTQPVTTIDEAVRATAVGIATNEAITTGRAVDIVMPSV
ncbi:MAG: Gfo/Idh/MocA family oxidoreductase [Planctomycetota bacterium]